MALDVGVRSGVPVVAAAENISLAERFSQAEAASNLLPASDWHPIPRADERAAWEQVPQDARDEVLNLAAEYAARDVPSLPATLYLEYCLPIFRGGKFTTHNTCRPTNSRPS